MCRSLSVLCFFLLSSFAFAQAPPVRIQRVARPPEISEFPGGAPTEAGMRISEFRQFAPGESDDVQTWGITLGRYIPRNSEEGRENLVLDSMGRRADLRPIRNLATTTGRQLFFKLSWLFRY